MKWYLGLVVQLSKIDRDGTIQTATPVFTGRVNIAYGLDKFDDHYDKSANKIVRDFERFLEYGSGWILDRVINILVNIASYQPTYEHKDKEIDSEEIEKPSNDYASDGSVYDSYDDESVWRDVFVD